jgi:hypothetical protein
VNIEKLIAAAKEIDALAEKSSARSKAWQELAHDAKKPDADRREIDKRRQSLDAGVVVDFGTAIQHLRNALHGR